MQVTDIIAYFNRKVRRVLKTRLLCPSAKFMRRPYGDRMGERLR